MASPSLNLPFKWRITNRKIKRILKETNSGFYNIYVPKIYTRHNFTTLNLIYSKTLITENNQENTTKKTRINSKEKKEQITPIVNKQNESKQQKRLKTKLFNLPSRSVHGSFLRFEKYSSQLHRFSNGIMKKKKKKKKKP